MFECDRYISKGVHNAIPVVLQVIMWEMIDRMNVEKDYFQVFHLTPDELKNTVHIKHFQEVPAFEEETDYKLDDFMIHNSYKIYVIDSEEYCAMILSSEY